MSTRIGYRDQSDTLGVKSQCRFESYLIDRNTTSHWRTLTPHMGWQVGSNPTGGTNTFEV